MRYQKISFIVTGIIAVVVGYLIFTSNYRPDVPNWLLFLFLALSIAVAVSQWREKRLISELYWPICGYFNQCALHFNYIGGTRFV